MKYNKVILLSCVVLSIIFLVKISESGKVLGVFNSKKIVSVRYFPFSQSAFDASRVYLRTICFLASWDEYCQKADREISSSQGTIPDKAVIFKADFDSEVALKHKYGLDIKHECVVIDPHGNIITKSAPEKILRILKLL